MSEAPPTPPPTPDDWKAHWSKRKSSWFFQNVITKQVTWDLPKVVEAKPEPKPEPKQPQAKTLEALSALSSALSSASAAKPNFTEEEDDVVFAEECVGIVSNYNRVAAEKLGPPPSVAMTTTAPRHRQPQQPQRPPRKQLMVLNNYLKTTLLEMAFLIWDPRRDQIVLDLAAGSGGDVPKYAAIMRKLRRTMAKYVAIDVAGDAIEFGRTSRARLLPLDPAQQRWIVDDLKNRDVASKLASTGTLPPGTATVASMQFALHYFFDSAESLETLLALVSASLCEGGVFVATYADGDEVVRRCREARWAHVQRHGADPESVAVFNAKYRIDMPTGVLKAVETSHNPFGFGYKFWLEGAVAGVMEYLVVDSVLVERAAAHDLSVVLQDNFHAFTHSILKVEHHKDTMRRMKVFDAAGSGGAGSKEVGKAEWDVAGLYKAALFVKDSKGDRAPSAKAFLTKHLYP